MPPILRSARLLAIAALSWAAACGSDTSAPVSHLPASIALEVPAVEVYHGDIVEVRATVRDERGAIIPNASVTWSASNPARAEVAPNGTTTFIGTGAVTLTATAGAITATHAFDVKPLHVLQVTVMQSRQLLASGDLVPIGVRVQGEGGRDVLGRLVTLASDDPTIVAFDYAGRLRAIKPGTATIRATVEGVTGTGRVQVVDDQAVLSLSRVGGGKLPLLVVADSVSWNGVREYHEVFIEGGRLIVTDGDSSRYSIEIRYAEYSVTGDAGSRKYALRATWRERDFGEVARQGNGALVMTSEYVSPLQHTATGVTDGWQVRYRIGGTDEYLDLLYRRD